MTAGTTLFKMVRVLTSAATAPDAPQQRHGRLVMAIEAIDDASKAGPATINAIAAQMGIDQSGASRLVTQAIAAGLVERAQSPSDGRERTCYLTAAGAQLLGEARIWQEQVFATLTSDWSDSEREQFVASLARITAAAESRR